MLWREIAQFFSDEEKDRFEEDEKSDIRIQKLRHQRQALVFLQGGATSTRRTYIVRRKSWGSRTKKAHSVEADEGSRNTKGS